MSKSTLDETDSFKKIIIEDDDMHGLLSTTC